MHAFDLTNIRFRYRGADTDALAGASLAAGQGETVAVIGLTGAGKSTLLKCLARLAPASQKGEFEGEVSLLGEDAGKSQPSALAGKVGIVFQDFESQLFSTTAELDAAFGPENLGLATDEIRARVDEALSSVGMIELRDRDPDTLSGGQKQRLAIAAILSLRPRILCLDEPVTDLDPEGREEVAALVKDLCASGMTVLLAEHEIDLLRACGRIAGIKSGKIAFDLPAEEVLADPGRLVRFGVRPPDVTRVLLGLGLTGRAQSVAEAAKIITDNGFGLPPDSASQLEEKDKAAGDNHGDPIVNVQNLTHCYPNGFEALRGVSLEVCAGEFVCLLGRNGSGKTTLAKHLNGLLAPSGGTVLVEGADTREAGPAALGKKIGFVFQDPDHQIFAATVREEVSFAPRNFGFSEEEVEKRTASALELVGMGESADRDPFILTKGERQRVALASVLSAEPGIIVMDEPTTGLDYPAQRAVMELLARLNREGRTIIIITHTLWVAAEYARRCLVMSGGELIGDGTARRILSDARLLAQAGLRMPEIAALGLELGAPMLSVEEMLDQMKRSG